MVTALNKTISYLKKQLFWPKYEKTLKCEQRQITVMSNNLILFVHYSKFNIIDDSDVLYVKQLSSLGEIVFISNSNLVQSEIDKILPYSVEVVIRENYGYDFGAWKYYINNNECKIRKYDNLLLVNNSVYASLRDMKEIFESFDSNPDIDYWGITAFTENERLKSHESYILDVDKISQHIQSYFIVFKKKMIEESFFRFWRNLPYCSSFVETVKKGEVGLTPYFQDFGFHWDVFCQETKRNDKVHVDGPDMSKYEPDILLMHGCPLVKKKSLALITERQFDNIKAILKDYCYTLTAQIELDRKTIEKGKVYKFLNYIFERS